jgi:hypothetical protein
MLIVPNGALSVSAFQAPIDKSRWVEAQTGQVSATVTVTAFPLPPTPSSLPVLVTYILQPHAGAGGESPIPKGCTTE